MIPVHNEEATLSRSVHRLRWYLDCRFPLPATVTIVDNASTDGTWEVACRLATDVPGVRATHLGRKGRGGALRSAWLASSARVVAYMDVDLSTDLDALLPLVAPLLSGHSDLSIGTRLAPGAHVVRGAKREFISRGYNHLLHAALGGRFTDAQCGFKAIRTETARALLPLVRDNGWFFDTELLVLAQRNGLRIHEVPVDWVDDPDSRVDIAATARADLLGVWRLLRSSAGPVEGAIPARHGDDDRVALARVTGVGVVSTLVYLALFVVLRLALGPYGANALALVVTALGNASLHAWLDTGHAHLLRDRRLAACLAEAAVAGLVLTTGALAVASMLGATSVVAQVVAVALGTAIAAPVRFLVVHRSSTSTSLPTSGGSPPARRSLLAPRRRPVACKEDS